MTNKTRKWIRAGLETLIHGGAAALGSTMSAAIIDGGNFALFTSNSYKMMTTTFMLNGGLRFVQWWQNNPLPPGSDTTPPFPGITPPTMSLNPLTQVQQIPKEEKK